MKKNGSVSPEKALMHVYIPRSLKEQIKVSVKKYKGQPFVDCRIYVESRNGLWRPTKKGITFNVSCIEGVIKALVAAAGALIRASKNKRNNDLRKCSS